jgi:hypothetical protein
MVHRLLKPGRRLLLSAVAVGLWGMAVGARPAGADPVDPVVATLAMEGEARFPVVVAATASPRVRAAAEELATYLGRLGGAAFATIPGDGRSGIVVGTAAEFPDLPVSAAWRTVGILEREDYCLRSHDRGLWVVGATDLAVEHAVWDVLHRLGFRQFFPGDHWEIVPRQGTLAIACDVVESPDYHTRRIWYGFGAWDYARQPYAEWCRRNRAMPGVDLKTGHAYDAIIARHRETFAERPELLALVDGRRRGPKLCIGNPDLRRLVVEDSLARFVERPQLDSISMDPSDGGGWCECPECAKLGSVTDQALTLANEVAAAVNERHPGRLVSIYAYAYHSPPPAIEPHPQVVVSVATAFIRGGYSLEEIITGWSEKNAVLGVREYYSVNTWDRDLPAAARGGNPAWLSRTIPEFHARGARFMSAEASDNWGPNGLGYYLAARMLWDVSEARRVEQLTDDFLAAAFGPASEAMRAFYDQLDGSKPQLGLEDQLARMVRGLEAAYEAVDAAAPADAAAIRRRLDDLTQYARYCDLFHRYQSARGAARQRGFEDLVRHVWRMRTTMLVHAHALLRDLPQRDRSITLPPECRFNAPPAGNPWRSDEPYAAAAGATFRAEAIERYPLVDVEFEPLTFGDDLRPATPLALPAVAADSIGHLGAASGTQVFQTLVDDGTAGIELQITAAAAASGHDPELVHVALWKIGGASQTGERETLVAEQHDLPADGRAHTVTLEATEPGVHEIRITSAAKTSVAWPAGRPMVVKSSADQPMNPAYTDYWMMHFYVPRGTRTVGIHGGDHGEIHDAEGHPLFWLNGRPAGYYSIPVPDGQDGRLWRIRYGRGPIRLLTVPPYLARAPEELLLPPDVVERDAE